MKAKKAKSQKTKSTKRPKRDGVVEIKNLFRLLIKAVEAKEFGFAQNIYMGMEVELIRLAKKAGRFTSDKGPNCTHHGE
jgi:hypothetical protein